MNILTYNLHGNKSSDLWDMLFAMSDEKKVDILVLQEVNVEELPSKLLIIFEDVESKHSKGVKILLRKKQNFYWLKNHLKF